MTTAPSPILRKGLSPRRSWGIVVLVSGLAGGLLVNSGGASAAAALPAGSPTVLSRTAPVALAPGVAVSRENFTVAGLPEQAFLASVTLSAHVSVAVVAAHDRVGAAPETTTSMTARRGALLGLNGDLFDILGTGLPFGGIAVAGQLLKSPRPGWPAQLAVLGDGRVRIGPVSFTGSVTVSPAAGRPAVVRPVTSVNTPSDAAGGGLSLITNALAPQPLPAGCVAVTGRYLQGQARVVTVAAVRRTPNVPRGGWALLGCRQAGRWLAGTLRQGVAVRVGASVRSAGAGVAALLSGARQVIRNGASYDDRSGFRTWGRNPETFACASADGRRLLLGVIDGRRFGAAGVTLDELTSYLHHLHCWDAIVFDGGGSSTLAARLGGRVTPWNIPSDWGYERPVADALIVRVH